MVVVQGQCHHGSLSSGVVDGPGKGHKGNEIEVLPGVVVLDVDFKENLVIVVCFVSFFGSS